MMLEVLEGVSSGNLGLLQLDSTILPWLPSLRRVDGDRTLMNAAFVDRCRRPRCPWRVEWR